MTDRKSFGWAASVLALTIVACTCSALPDLDQIEEEFGTAQAVVTQVGTTQALATRMSAGTPSSGGGVVGRAPDDIPVYGDNQNLFGSKDVVSYSTRATYKTVLEFYKRQMPNQGWVLNKSAPNFETDTATVLYYEKGAAKATLTLSYVPTTKQTSVQVLITGR